MAKIVTLKILVDDAGESDEAIEELVKTALMSSQPDNGVLDYLVAAIEPIRDELGDSLVNETYQTGDAFNSWLIYSASEAKASNNNDGFWSYQYGWTSRDLATRLEPIAREMPHCVGDDAVMIIDL